MSRSTAEVAQIKNEGKMRLRRTGDATAVELVELSLGKSLLKLLLCM